MRRRLESVTAIGRKIGINDDKGYGVAVFLALIVVVVVVAGFFVSSALNPPVGYSTIYLLDENQTATDYAEVLVAGQNSTFNVWLAVENHHPEDVSYVVQVKIAETLSTYPQNVTAIQTYETGTVASQGSWSNRVTLTQDTPGDYAVVFELYKLNGDTAEFTHNYCVLNIEVTS
jgi:uncharacterized membrane protein